MKLIWSGGCNTCTHTEMTLHRNECNMMINANVKSNIY